MVSDRMIEAADTPRRLRERPPPPPRTCPDFARCPLPDCLCRPERRSAEAAAGG